MSSFCKYLHCHNLASSNFGGYCNEYHRKQAEEIKPLLEEIKKNPAIKTLAQARIYLTSIGK